MTEDTLHLPDNWNRRHPQAKCEECPLNDPKNGFVPSQIPSGTVSVAVVGEAPGFQETAYKRPFMGPSGKLLKRVLDYHDIAKSEVLLTNVCLCRPPDNATPPKAAVNACRGRLLHEIVGSGTHDVVALGSTAAHALIDSTASITNLRIGTPKSPTRALDGSGVERVVATWHPAYCLRTADAFPALVNDIGKLKEDNREPWREPRYQVFDDPDGALRAIAELELVADTLYIDIEVGIDKDESFFHPNEFDLLCVGLAYAKGKAVVFGKGALEDPRVRNALTQLLRHKRLAAHNGKFDLAGLQPYCGTLKLWFDTMLGSYCLDERPGNHGLKVRAIEDLGAPDYALEIKQYIPKGDKNYANIPRPILYKYNAYDVGCGWDLMEIQMVRLARPIKNWPYPDRDVKTLRDVHDMLVRASNQLMFLELNGIAFDLPYNFELGNRYLERLGFLESEINEIVRATTGQETSFEDPDLTPAKVFNPRSPKQITAFLATQGHRVASTNVATLTALAPRLAQGSYARQFVSALLRHRREQKLYSTYVVGLRKRVYRGRVYTTYLLHGTTSGRLASRNPNLQNIVRDKTIRKQFVVSKPGNVLIQADYKQAELRVMTTLAKDEYFKSILSDPEADLFTELVCQLYHVSKEEALNGSAASKEMRIRIKAFVYGLGYGREVASIAKEFKIPFAEGQKLRDDFFNLIPGIATWQSEIKALVHKTGRLITPFGRQRRFHLITDQNKKDVENEALSYLPQSTASDICLRAFTAVRPMLRGLAFVRLTIHDALVVECHGDRVGEVSNILTSTMEQSGREFTNYVPFTTDVSIGTTWGDL
jgi:uracil-DNA glycosylase family 4